MAVLGVPRGGGKRATAVEVRLEPRERVLLNDAICWWDLEEKEASEVQQVRVVLWTS